MIANYYFLIWPNKIRNIKMDVQKVFLERKKESDIHYLMGGEVSEVKCSIYKMYLFCSV